ncbi:MAG: 4-hydroxy-tetrahydrodipicolinate synthase, partial [Firmicutes bacterium]|nr:4-hydroxy-tetrahydrodipicolinate synthase [Bacillota bacterium]
MSVFTGSAVALVTPFNKDFTVNFDELGRLLEFHISNKTDAILVCGTTGEASTLTDEEQIECIRFAVDKVKGRVPVLAGAGSNHTDHGVDLARGCAAAGADMLLLVTPYYNKTTQKGLIEHYGAIASSVDIPVCLYNVPGRTGMNINPETCLKLSKVPNIVGIKEASGNLSQVAQIAALCGPDFDIYSGNDDQILPVLSLGGKGVISVLANVAPAQTHEMVASYLAGDSETATKMQIKAIELCNALFCEV